MAPESRDEVRQRIDSLYDQAENATGNYNATRAAGGGSRSRGVPLFKRPRRDDPGLDNIAREWFEGARAKLGPSVPAALPTDRMPERPGPRRPVSAMAADLLAQLEDSGPARLELTAGSGQSEVEVVRELPARPKLELTAGSAGAVTAAPSDASRALPSAAPQRPTPGAFKTRNQLKLAKAREMLSQRTGPRAVAALEPAQVPAAQPVPQPPSPWPTPERQAPAAPQWQAPAVGIPSQRTGSDSARTDALAATRALPAVTETGGIPIVSPSDTGTFRIMTPGGADRAPRRATPDPSGFRVMTPGNIDATPAQPTPDTSGFRVMTPGSADTTPNQPGPDTSGFRVMTPGSADTTPNQPGPDTSGFRVMTPGNADATPNQPTPDLSGFRVMTPGNIDTTPNQPGPDTSGFRVMTPGGSGGGTYQSASSLDAGVSQAPTPGDSGSFRIMTPGATGSFPMPTPADAGAFPNPDAVSTSVLPPVAPTNSGAFPTAATTDSGAFPTATPAAPAPAPGPMDLGGFRVMSPNAPAAYAEVPQAAADTAYATGAYTYPTAAPAAPAPMAAMAPMPSAPSFAAAPAAGMTGGYTAGPQPAETGYAYATAAMPTAAPAAAMPAPMPTPMTAPMPAAMTAQPEAMTAAMATATASAPAPAPPMAMPPLPPVVTAPLPTTPLATAPAQVAAPAPAAAMTAPAPMAAPVAFAEPGKAMKALAFAREQIGRPCVWGATGPGAYDCSSLTQAAWRAAGVTLPRSAPEQTLAGTPITLAAVEPGDLIFFFDDDSHVGIYAGGGTMVHAPSPGALIREESIYNAGESAIHRVIRPA
ncbi:NlpC/P60 family protein [Streptomyces sp. NPDC051987]|uniref:NlpC/P60 family protein n=1 Tax=Streptomyces sp. NPDC051987 TaxID=3155808 RepID=UPI00341B6A20